MACYSYLCHVYIISQCYQYIPKMLYHTVHVLLECPQGQVTPPEDDRATARSNMHKKFDEDRMSSSRDMLADRQTDTVITIKHIIHCLNSYVCCHTVAQCLMQKADLTVVCRRYCTTLQWNAAVKFSDTWQI